MSFWYGFASVMTKIGIGVGVISTFLVFFIFMSKKNEHRFEGILGKVYNFLHFRKYIVESILKFLYVFGACMCTSVGIFVSLTIIGLPVGIPMLIFGNLLIRIIYELVLMQINSFSNINSINMKMDQLTRNAGNGNMGAYEMPGAVPPTGPAPTSGPVPTQGPAQAAPQAPVTPQPAPGKVCSVCGTVNEPDSAFCGECGAKL